MPVKNKESLGRNTCYPLKIFPVWLCPRYVFFLTGTILFFTFKCYIIAMSSGTGRIPMNTRMRCHSLFITNYIVCMKYLSNYGTGVIIILNMKNSITSNESK